MKSFKTIDLSQQSEDMIKFRVPTGLKALDLITGGGFPGGRLSEIYGPWASGKTRIAMHAVAQTIKLGGFAIISDNERSLSKGLLDLTGVDSSGLIYADPTEITCIEDVFNVMIMGIEELRAEKSDGLFTFVWDSVATTPSREEFKSGDISMNTNAMRRAKIISDGLKKIMPVVHENNVCLIFINQIRDRMNVQYGEKVDTVGGKSIKFQASLRLNCKIIGQIKDEKTRELTGYKGQVKVEKSKVCKPFGIMNFEMSAEEPIHEYAGLLEYYVRHSVVEHTGSGWYKFADTPKFRKQDFPEWYEKHEDYFLGDKDAIHRKES